MDRLACGLLTYLLHSTLLLGAALAARAVLRERRLALQEALLRAALVGGFVTAGLQVGLGVQPLGGAWTLAPAASEGPLAATAATAPRRVPLSPAAPAQPAGVRLDTAPPAIHAALAGARPPSRALLAVLWASLAGLALARLGAGAARLHRLLRDRRPLDPPELVRIADLAASLGLRPPVRVSTAARLTVPLATGVVRPEVCLPPRALSDLPLDEQTALCAHELAHVARRDPAWLLLARLIEALAPVQPLNLWARRRLQDLAECLADDLAVRASGRPLGLARSLVDVASWTHPGFTPVTASGAQGARSRLGHRVERLMDPVRTLESPGRILLPLAGVLVLATALVTPVVSSGEGSTSRKPARQAEPPTPPAVPPVPAVPAVPPAGALGTPPAAPAPPVAPAAPAAPTRDDDVTAGGAERRLERLSRRIEERAQRHQAESARIEAEMEALTSQLQPHEKDLERLSAELETAAREMARSALEKGEKGSSSERTAAAHARMQQLQEQMREAVEGLRLPQADLRRLSEKARSLAEIARPSDEELAELRSLAQDVARESLPDAREIERLTREADGQVREEMRRAAEEMKKAAEEMKRAHEEMRHAHERDRESQHP